MNGRTSDPEVKIDIAGVPWSVFQGLFSGVAAVEEEEFERIQEQILEDMGVLLMSWVLLRACEEYVSLPTKKDTP